MTDLCPTFDPLAPDPVLEVTVVGPARVRLKVPDALAAAFGARVYSSIAPDPKDPTVFWTHPRQLQSARALLESVKPPRVGPDGEPMPWVPSLRRATLRTHRDEEDVLQVATLPALPEREAPTAPLLALHRALCERLGITTALPLVVEPSPELKDGFCAGRIWFDLRGKPLRIHLFPCKNADLAEQMSTLVHELAHTQVRPHDHRFKAALLKLAQDQWGAAFFQAVELSEPYADVDRLVAVGIRAALEGRSPPRRETADSGDTAKLVVRIRKLQALAKAQPGEPEGVAAMAKANELITLYGLGGYGQALLAGIDEQMVDRFMRLHPRRVWERNLAFEVAKYFGVFALSMARQSRMHLFGRYADVVAAQFLVEICVEKLTRAAAETRRGRSEKTAFLDSAVLAFGQKLKALKAEQTRHAEPSVQRAYGEAETFARELHEARGLGWGTESAKRIHLDREGLAAGEALEVVRGVEGRAQLRLICSPLEGR